MDGIADYRFVARLGAGGAGVTHLAERPARLPVAADRVVVKVLTRRATHEEFHRIADELRMMASIGSENLGELYDVGLSDGLVYYAMAHYPDGSLSRPATPMPDGAPARVVADAARGAHALHEAGIVHRAIRPSNILLSGGRGRLSDIGLAHLQAPGMSSTGLSQIGSLEFADPALLGGAPASRQTDIWSLGIVLHRAVAGEGVYGGITSTDTLGALREFLHAQPRLSAALSPAHREIVERCIAADPDRRYATAAELADAIEAAEGAR
jgi:serine/threonine protein kinase